MIKTSYDILFHLKIIKQTKGMKLNNSHGGGNGGKKLKYVLVICLNL